LRQPILYAEELWRRQRLWAVLLLAVGVLFPAATLFYPPLRAGSSNWVFYLYLPAGLLLGGGGLYYRWRSQIHVADEGITIRTLFSHVFIEYDMVRSVRVQPLDRHYQEARKRLVRAQFRPLLTRPALYLRLKGEEARLAYIAKKLGRQLYADETIALPVPDPDSLSWEVSARLPERVGTNLGGQRRRKRGR
jgi:hypothetical protein